MNRTATVAASLDTSVDDALATAAILLYDAETTLHAARASQIDQWVAAAYDRLHEAIEQYLSALGA